MSIAAALWDRMAHAQTVFLTASVFVCYGLSLFANSAASSFVGGGLHWSTAILLNSIGRAITGFGVVGLLCARRYRQDAISSAASAQKGWSLPTISVSVASLTPIAALMAGYLGFFSFYQLLAQPGSVSLYVPALGTYSIVPIMYGLLVRGERRSFRKFAGIALSILSIVLLGVSGSQSADNDAVDPADTTQSAGESDNSSDVMKLILFLTTFFAWGFADILSASIKLDTLTCICVNVVGQLLIASVSGFVVLTRLLSLLATGVLDGNEFVAPVGISFGWPHFMIMSANGLAIVGWLLFVKASQTQPLSRLIPVLSQYTLLPVVLALLFLGEELSWWKAAGMVVGAAAVLVVSTSQSEPGAAASQAGKHLDEAGAVEEHGGAPENVSSSSAVIAPSSAQESSSAAGAAVSTTRTTNDTWATSSSQYVYADPSRDMSAADEAPTESSVAMHYQPRGALPAAGTLDTVELLVRA